MPYSVTLPVIDDFQRANETPLNLNWVTSTQWWVDGLRLISNQGRTPAAAPFGGSVWTAQTWDTPLLALVQFAALPGKDSATANYFSIELFNQNTAVSAVPDGYEVTLLCQNNQVDLQLSRLDAGVATGIGTVLDIEFLDTDGFGVRLTGTTLGAYRVRAGVWTSLFQSTLAGVPPVYTSPFYLTIGGEDDNGATPGRLRLASVSAAALTSATRFYPTKASPSDNIVLPTPTGYWDSPTWQEREQTYVLSTSKTNGGVAQAVQYNTNQQANWKRLINRFMSRPLAAQTISGTFDLCAFVQAVWLDPVLSPSNLSDVRFRIRVYVTDGQSTTLKHLLLDHTDAVSWPGTGGQVWRSLVGPPSMTGFVCDDGDSIMVEFGLQVVSSPTPAYGYPPPIPPGQNATSAPHLFLGTTNTSNVPLTDATPGSTTLALAPWVDFQNPVILLPPIDPPANDACADAVVIASLPYTAPRIATTESAGTQKEVWYTHTFTQTGKVVVSALGSNYLVQIDAARVIGSPACSNLDFELPYARQERLIGTTQSIGLWSVVSGETWYFRLRSKVPVSTDNGAPESGGSLRIRVFMQEVPQEDDLILPCGHIGVFRDGVMIAVNVDNLSLFPTGVAIDYTERPMLVSPGFVNTNTTWRLHVGLFGIDFVRIYNLLDLTLVDDISEPLETPLSPGVQVRKHPSTLYIDASGLETIAFFGNGLQWIDGFGQVLPSLLNTVPSDLTVYGGMRVIDATHGDHQVGAPFTAGVLTAPAEVTNPWAITLQEITDIYFYTSGSLYVPLGGQEVRRVTAGGTALGTFATLPTRVTANPGVRGLVKLPDGGVLVCNGDVVQRLSSSGAIVSTYAPSVPALSRVLQDVKLTADGQFAWVVDLGTNALFKFRLSDMTEILSAETDMLPGTLTQMAIVQPLSPPVPPTTTGCPELLAPGPVDGVACATQLQSPAV